MIKTEFGIIESINTQQDYSHYEPEKYNCIAIDDDLYINDWWESLNLMVTFHHKLSNPQRGLSRWGVTLIPPDSLSQFQDIVISDKRIYTDDNLVKLAEKIQTAIEQGKFMIHYGV